MDSCGCLKGHAVTFLMKLLSQNDTKQADKVLNFKVYKGIFSFEFMSEFE